eukprot:66090_1
MEIEDTAPLLNAEIQKQKHRMVCFDALRGLLVILAAEDHARFIIAGFPGEEFWSGMHPNYYSYYNGNIIKAIYIFFTRLITHLAAPGFYLLMGFGMVQYYQHRKLKLKWSTLTISKYFIIRGLIITFIGGIILNFAFYSNNNSNIPGGPTYERTWWSPDILFVLGLSMIIFAPIISFEHILFIHNKYFAIFLIISITLFSMLSTEFIISSISSISVDDDGIINQNDTVYSWFAVVLYISGKTGWVYHNFTLVPWFTPLCVGILYGRLFCYFKNINQIEKYFYYIKITTTILFMLFIFIRIGNVLFYGNDISASFGNFYINWNWSGNHWHVFQFFRTTKFPPSISHLCLTIMLLQICLLIFYQLSFVWQYNISKNNIFVLFGRVTLFCWVLHWFLLRPIGLLFGLIIDSIFKSGANEIARMICIWPMVLTICCIMYKPAKWYLQFKLNKPVQSLWRLL